MGFSVFVVHMCGSSVKFSSKRTFRNGIGVLKARPLNLRARMSRFTFIALHEKYALIIRVAFLTCIFDVATLRRLYYTAWRNFRRDVFGHR